MEEYFYRCKQILEEILTSQGFIAQPETYSLGQSIVFIKDDLEVIWLYDLRDQGWYLGMMKNKKSVGSGNFGNIEQLKKSFLTKLEELLSSQGFAITERNRHLAIGDLTSFQTQKTKNGFLAGLFGNK
ncbi:MAG: hypothetical protein C4586_00370 [Anaerolineaceae bacterium]|nr:MAG: hypothetical protein C4586_00370 [Anaerolineaceae bacterium]